jgi:hypothetical protein
MKRGYNVHSWKTNENTYLMECRPDRAGDNQGLQKKFHIVMCFEPLTMQKIFNSSKNYNERIQTFDLD